MAIDLSAPSSTPEQTLLALAILGAAAVGLIILGYRARYKGLLRSLARDAGTLSGAKADATFSTLRLDGDTDFHDFLTREKLRRLVDPDDDVDRPTASDAIGEVKASLVEAWMPVVMELPKPARWLLSLAVNITAFGLLAVSTDVVLQFLRTNPRPTQDISAWPSVAASQSAAALDLASTVILSIPGADIVWSVTFTVAVLLVSWLYSHWYVSAVLLAIGAGLITYFHRKADVSHERINSEIPTARSVARTLGGGALFVWGVMLVGIGFGRRFVSNSAGVKVGLVMAGVTAIAGVGYLLYRQSDRFRRANEWLRAVRAQDRDVQLVTAVRLGWVALAAVVAPLLPVYVVVALTKIPTIVGAFLSAAPEVQVLVLTVVGLAVGLLAWQAREAWEQVYTSLVELWSHQQVKAVAVGQGLPLFGVVFTYVVAYGFLQSIVMAASVAMLGGLVARAVYKFAIRVKYRAGGGEPVATPASRVVIQAAALEDDAGDTHWYARVNGSTELLHPDREALLDDLVDVASELTSTGGVPATVSEWHAQFAFNHGITEPSETREKLGEKVRKHIFHYLRKRDRLALKDYLYPKVDDIPTEIRDERIDKHIKLGNIRDRGRYLELRNDPYS